MPDADSPENSASERDTPSRLRGWLQALLLLAAIAAALALYWAAVDTGAPLNHGFGAAPGSREILLSKFALDLQIKDVAEGRLKRVVALQEAVDAEDLARLAKLRGLESITIGVFEGNQEDLALLAESRDLESLDLYEVPLADDGAAALARVENLRALNIDRSELTDEGLAELAKLPKLELLRLRVPRVTDAGVEELTASPSLRHLHLIGAQLTDRSLETVASMQKLESFYVDGVELSPAAWRKFLAARPDVHVHVDEAHLPDATPSGE